MSCSLFRAELLSHDGLLLGLLLLNCRPAQATLQSALDVLGEWLPAGGVPSGQVPAEWDGLPVRLGDIHVVNHCAD